MSRATDSSGLTVCVRAIAVSITEELDDLLNCLSASQSPHAHCGHGDSEQKVDDESLVRIYRSQVFQTGGQVEAKTDCHLSAADKVCMRWVKGGRNLASVERYLSPRNPPVQCSFFATWSGALGLR